MNIIKAILLTSILASSQVFACDFASIMPRNTGEVNPVTGEVIMQAPAKATIVCNDLTVSRINTFGTINGTIKIVGLVTNNIGTWKLHVLVSKKDERSAALLKAYGFNFPNHIDSTITLESNCNTYNFYSDRVELSTNANRLYTNNFFPEEWISSESFGVSSNSCVRQFAFVPNEDRKSVV